MSFLPCSARRLRRMAAPAIFRVKGETLAALIQCTLGAGGVEALPGAGISRTLAASPRKPLRSGGGEPESPAGELGTEPEEREE